MTDELVVLCDEDDNELGVLPKGEVHHNNTPLHRAFSIFLFRPSLKASERQVTQELLVQQRAMSKKTWPGVWSNSCCGHPFPGESREDGVRRRVKYELGVEIEGLQKVSDYRYRFERDGVVENEVCPIFVGRVLGEVRPNPHEVMDYRWVNWEEWLEEVKIDEENIWSEWCKEEAAFVKKYLIL
jgi:isopentenyl-diphosphate Delta-isomerase